MDRQEGVHHFSGSYTQVMGGHNLKAGAEIAVQLPRLRAAGISLGPVHLRPGYHLQGSLLLRRATRATAWRRCSSAGRRAAISTSTRRSSRDRPTGASTPTTTGGSSPKLTLNLGLRYDFDVPRWETQDRQSYWDLEAQSPIQVPGYDTRGVIKFVDGDKRSPFDARHEQRAAAARLRLRRSIPRRPSAAATDCSTRSAAPPCSAIPAARSTSTRRRRSRSTPTPRATRRSPIPYPERHAAAAGQRRWATAPSSAWAPAPSCRATTATPSTTPGTCRSSARSAGARSSRPTTPAAAARTCSSRSRP